MLRNVKNTRPYSLQEKSYDELNRHKKIFDASEDRKSRQH